MLKLGDLLKSKRQKIGLDIVADELAYAVEESLEEAVSENTKQDTFNEISAEIAEGQGSLLEEIVQKTTEPSALLSTQGKEATAFAVDIALLLETLVLAFIT